MLTLTGACVWLQLKWNHAPTGGGGWWHWNVLNQGVWLARPYHTCAWYVYYGCLEKWAETRFYLFSMKGSCLTCRSSVVRIFSHCPLDRGIWSSLSPRICRVIDSKVVKSPPMAPPVTGWGEVGHYFNRCIMKALKCLTLGVSEHHNVMTINKAQ